MSGEREIQVGDRWIYTTPMGREILHEVFAVEEEANIIRLRAVDGSISDASCKPRDLQADWWRLPRPARHGTE